LLRAVAYNRIYIMCEETIKQIKITINENETIQL
jgi:hypothetical protein